MKIFFAAALALLISMAFFITPASAQSGDRVDMLKITCKEFAEDKENMPMMIMWIDGYMSGTSGNSNMDQEWIEELTSHMVSYCRQYPSRSVGQAIEDMP